MAQQDRPTDKPAARTPQPWHAADEAAPPSRQRGGGAPVGTHSLTGGGAGVGMPTAPQAQGKPERSTARDDTRPSEVDPLAEPRASIGEILGRKP